MKKYELTINENSKLLVECRKTEFCSRWCEIFLINKNKLNSGHRSFNSLYLGDTSMEKLLSDFMEADEKIASNDFPKHITDDGTEFFRVTTFEVEYSTVYMSLPPNNMLMIIYGNPAGLLGKIKIQFGHPDFSEWVKVLKK